MTGLSEREVRISVGDGSVSGLLLAPKESSACYVLAHGAGVGMRHKFIAEVARGLAERQIATLRYQFPYMEQGRKSPGSPQAAHAAVRAACDHAAHLLPKTMLIAGGKSYGARMTSETQAEAPLDGVRGLAFLGFPLHAPGQPSDTRAEHLSRVDIPMLFLQGTRDDFADLGYLNPLVKRLGRHATLKLLEDADHSFHVPAKSGRTDAEVMAEMLEALRDWTGAIGSR